MATPGKGAARAAGRAARRIRFNSQAARIADRVARSVLIDPKALGKVLKSDDILKHIETDFPAAYKRMDNGLTLAEDQVTEIYHSIFANFGDEIAKSIGLDATIRHRADRAERVRQQMRLSTQELSAKKTNTAWVAERTSLEDGGRASLADSESSPEPTPRKGDSRFTEPGQSLMSGEEASDARTRANEQFERIRTGTQRPPRQSGPDRFRGTREGINPEALKTGADPADEGLRYAGRYYYRDPETGKLFSEVKDNLKT